MKVEKMFQIYAPEEARTKDSILVLWDKINEGSETLLYEIFVNEHLYRTVNCTDETLTDLVPDTEYSVRIQSILNVETYCTQTITVRTKAEGPIYNIVDFGASSDVDAVNTDAI